MSTNNGVVRINIPQPSTPTNAQTAGTANNAATPQNEIIITVSQATQTVTQAAQLVLRGTVPTSGLSHQPTKKELSSRTVPFSSPALRETLKKAGVPSELIEKISPSQPVVSQTANSSPTSRTNNSLDLSFIPAESEQPKVTKIEAFVINLLNKGYMQYLRFEEGDLPFSKEICEQLAKDKATVEECLRTLEQTAKELSDELTKSCFSNCLPESNCSVNKKTALLALVLIAWTVLGIAGGTIIGNNRDAARVLLILGYLISGGVLTGKLVSYNLSGKKEEADATAQRNLLEARTTLDKALESIKKILTEQQELLQRRAQHLIKDYVDATPFRASNTNEEYQAALRLTYPEVGDDRKKMQMLRLKMELQAELIKHFVNRHFDRALPLIQNAMNRYIPASVMKENSTFQPDCLLKHFIDTKPIVSPLGSSLSETEMFRVYKERRKDQAEFVRLASAAKRSGQTLPSDEPGHVLAVRLFPLSCASIAPAQFVKKAERGSMTAPSDSSSTDSLVLERKGNKKNGQEEARSPSSVSNDVKDPTANERKGRKDSQSPQNNLSAGRGTQVARSTTRSRTVSHASVASRGRGGKGISKYTTGKR